MANYFIETEDDKSGTLTGALSSAETSTINLTPVPAKAPGLIRINPGQDNEEEIYYGTRDSGAGTIGTLTRDFSNLNGGTGQDHANGDSFEIVQSASYINQMVTGLLLALSQVGRILSEKLYAADGGANDTYTITLSPAPTAYATGMIVVFKANTVNTGACTLNCNSLGAKDLKILKDQDPPNGYIKAGSLVVAVYNGTAFEIISVKTTPGTKRLETASDGATVTFDLAKANMQEVTLGGNRTLALSNVQTGQVFTLKLIQDGTGSRTVTWFSTIKWAGGSAPTLTTTASKADMFGFVCTGSGTYDGFIIGQNI